MYLRYAWSIPYPPTPKFNTLNSFLRPTDGYLIRLNSILSPITNSTDGYIKKGKDLRGDFRKLSSLILNKICQIVISDKVKDYTSCIFFFRKDILKDVNINNTGYANFIIEFVSEAIIKNKSIIEVPFKQLKATEKNSKSAKNMIIYIKNGFLYILSILKSYHIKFKY